MQITREEIQLVVRHLLRQRAEAVILSKKPDEYYGWVPDQHDSHGNLVTPAHWLGEADEQRAMQALADARQHKQQADREHRAARYLHAVTPVEDAVLEQAHRQLVDAEQRLTKVQLVNALAIQKRRELMIERRAERLFYTMYRRATSLEWNLYHPAVSQDLRKYLIFWRKQPGLTPSSIVFLYLTLLETIDHGESFQTEALTAHDHLAKNPLVRAALDVNASEDQPSMADRQYVQALQTQHRYDSRPAAHANGDKRDILADFQYDGLPELGALYLDKNDGHECGTCHEKLTTKTVHNPKGYALAEVCPNHKDRVGCTHRPLTPRFATKTALRDHLCIQWAMSHAA